MYGTRGIVAMNEERRSYRRYALWFPVTLTCGGRSAWAICRDAGTGGMLVSSTAAATVGEEVTLTFRVRPQDQDIDAKGVVVRAWRNDDELLLAFPTRIAIEFDGPIRQLDSILPEALDTHQDT